MEQEATTQKKQIPEDIELVAGEGGVDGALTLLDNMAAMLNVLCAIDKEGEPMSSDDLARVFFILRQWTNFARGEINDWYLEKETAP